MTIKNKDLELLERVNEMLPLSEACELTVLIERLKNQRAKSRENTRQRAANNRKNGYVWKSSHHPKRSKYIEASKDERTLMQRFRDAGYTDRQLLRNGIDLLVEDNTITRDVLRKFCEDNKWHSLAEALDYPVVNDLVIETFVDDITGKKMISCFGQYYDEEVK